MNARRLIVGFLTIATLFPTLKCENKSNMDIIEDDFSPVVEYDSCENLVDGFTDLEKEHYKNLFTINDNRIVFNDSKCNSSDFDSNKVEILRKNTEIVNYIVDNVPYSYINENAEVDFKIPENDHTLDDINIDFEALWSANYVSASIWSIKFYLDNQFAFLFGLAGLIYRVVNYGYGIYSALTLTDDALTNVAFTAIIHLPMNIGCTAACNYIKSSAFQAFMNVVISGWNVLMITANSNPYSALVYNIIMLALGLCLPSLVTSVQMIYQAAKFKKGVYCEYFYFLLSFNWWTE